MLSWLESSASGLACFLLLRGLLPLNPSQAEVTEWVVATLRSLYFTTCSVSYSEAKMTLNAFQINVCDLLSLFPPQSEVPVCVLSR